MRQTAAIFLDAYRELNSKKLFWIVLAISLAVVIALALPVNNEKGIAIFGLTIDMPFFSTKALSPKGFYTMLLSNIGVNIWLTWGATILALISTAGMIPDMVSGGSIELTLSKPIGRARLFITKYFAGLMFVALQAAVFAIGAFAVIAIRGGAFRPQLLLAIPLVVAFYSYIFCICALIGLITRSTMAALLGALFFWLLLFSVGTVENVLLDQRLQNERDVSRITTQLNATTDAVKMLDEQIGRSDSADPGTPPASADDEPDDGPASAAEPPTPDTASPSNAPGSDRPGGNRPGSRRALKNLLATGQAMLDTANPVTDPKVLKDRRDKLNKQAERLKGELERAQGSLASIRKWHRGLYAGKTILPKTGETTNLLERYVIDKSDREGFLAALEERMNEGSNRDIDEALRNRPVWWVVGTSLAFQALVLGVAVWIFSRRDF